VETGGALAAVAVGLVAVNLWLPLSVDTGAGCSCTQNPGRRRHPGQPARRGGSNQASDSAWNPAYPPARTGPEPLIDIDRAI
jgi:hypothetical protein